MITQFQIRAFYRAAQHLRASGMAMTVLSTVATVRLGYAIFDGKGAGEAIIGMGIAAALIFGTKFYSQAVDYTVDLARREQDLERLRIEILKPQPRTYNELDPEYRSDAEVYIQEPDGSVSIYNEVRVSIKQLDRLYDMVQYGLKTNTRVLLTNDALTRPPHKVFTPGEFDDFIKAMRSEKLIIPKGKTQCLTERGERVIRQKWGLAHPQGKVSAIPLLPHWFGK